MSYITVSELQKMNGIYITNIPEGMRQYPFYILEGSKDSHYKFMTELSEENGSGAYGDFYFRRIGEDAEKLLAQYLNTQQMSLLKRLIAKGYEEKVTEDFYIVELTDEIMDLLLTISYEELLFSTFYFASIPCTIWSNYRGRFILFAQDTESGSRLSRMAVDMGLQVEQ